MDNNWSESDEDDDTMCEVVENVCLTFEYETEERTEFSDSENPNNKALASTAAPRFLSRGHTYRAVVGDTLVLPCEVENLGGLVLLWRRGTNVLTASQLMVTRDERIRLTDGYNLEISELEPQDAGDYVCQISDKQNKDQVHTVEILVPPSVRAVPQTGQLTARKGGTITLECKASGNPVPSIFWTKKQSEAGSSGKQSSRIGDGPILTLERVERQQAGVYQCTADNGVGEPVTVDMRLDVLYPPDISVEKSWIHSGEGFEAQLVCIVHADPSPTSQVSDLNDLREPIERIPVSEGKFNEWDKLLKNPKSFESMKSSYLAVNLKDIKKFLKKCILKTFDEKFILKIRFDPGNTFNESNILACLIEAVQEKFDERRLDDIEARKEIIATFRRFRDSKSKLPK